MSELLEDEQENEPSEITYAEHLHPARPRTLRFRPRVKAPFARRSGAVDGPATGENPRLRVVAAVPVDARRRQRDQPAVLRPGSMWQNPFANPDPRHAVESASVWFTAYPISLITRPGESFLDRAWRDEDMWKAFADDRHQRACTPGRSSGRAGSPAGSPPPAWTGTSTASAPRSTRPSAPRPSSGAMCGTANWYGGTIIDDVVPGHTGKGADFRLAEMKYADYPGIYHMVEIEPRRLGPAARRPRRAGLGEHRRRRARSGWTRPATSSGGCSG